MILAGKVALNSSAAITSQSLDFATLVKTGTGEYTITLEDKYYETKAVHLQVLQASGNLITAQVKADTQTSDKKIVINTYVEDNTSGVAAVANVGVAATIFITLIFKDSSVS